MNPFEPQVVIEVVRYVPPLWFIFSMSLLSMLLLAGALLMKDRTGFFSFVTSSIFVAVASAPYVYGFTPYALFGYLFTLILVMLGYIIQEYQHSRFSEPRVVVDR